ncbi:hypothetical protein [Sinimarinibacterium sp. NLF-5-8]|uniref:hypothetical protein n=1 Tax=Sinimarinibacterium sp. NLF-5-8 TaxID=2698684 RepID=UPI00137BD45C|nr:hypothetical protein [Sinimarinibacterium sp. NLF-5-8]QHS10597.1 hypothetical protein GT972_10940 [Sinimarinibacterium sp. NLF-5-8]
MKFKPLLTTLALSALPLIAFAGGTVTLEMGSGADKTRGQLEFDGSKIRMDAAGADEGYLLVHDQSAYAVTRQDGQTMVIDLASMGKMFGGLVEQMGSELPGQDVSKFIGLKKTGRAETVAGIKGEVHLLTYVDDDGQQKTDELVLSSDPRLREMTQALFTLSHAMARAFGVKADQINGTDKLAKELLGSNSGILRMGSDFRVSSINAASPAAARFALPAAPQQMPDLGKILQGQMPEGMPSLGDLMGR